MRAIDTNVLVRIVARDDERQARDADAFVSGGAWVSLIVLVEFAWVLDAVYARTAGQLATGVEMLLDHQDLVIQDAELVARALVVYKHNPSIGFSDCLILEQARTAGHVPLGTFDRKLSRLADVVKV
jgi:predicted nucleic-acid-binding protein